MLKKFKSIANLQSNSRSGSTQLTEKQIMAGFEGLDREICLAVKTQGPIRIICSGGACAVLLKSRPSTQDVDFYTPVREESLEVSFARAKLEDDRKYAHYPSCWINCNMIAHVSNLVGCENLFDNSVKMGHTIFIGKKLVVYAADWKFQFVGKVKRAFDGLEAAQEESGAVIDVEEFMKTDKHFGDALHFLHQIPRSQQLPLTLAHVRTWYYYGYYLTGEMIRVVNLGYLRRFGVANVILI